VSFPDLLFEPLIPDIEVILVLVDVEERRDGNSVLLEDEVFLVDVNPADKRSKVDPRLRQGKVADRRFRLPRG